MEWNYYISWIKKNFHKEIDPDYSQEIRQKLPFLDDIRLIRKLIDFMNNNYYSY